MSTYLASIANVRGREILDSRGNPTVEVDVILADGTRVPETQTHVVVRADVFAASSPHARHVLKAWRPEAVEFLGGSALPVPPYILGIWLGDGTTGQPSISKPMCQAVSEWIGYGASLGLGVRDAAQGARCPTWRLTNGRTGHENPAMAALGFQARTAPSVTSSSLAGEAGNSRGWNPLKPPWWWRCHSCGSKPCAP